MSLVSCLVPLAQAHDAAEHGGKASRLARLVALGLAVPDGFVVPDEVRREALAPVLEEIEALVRGGESARARELVLGVALPAGLEDALAGLAGRWIVRSSAAGEDGARASFAGQLDSFGDLEASALADAVRRCWASRWSERALAYERARGVRLEGMGVLVQTFVAARAAGVLFTRDPSGRSGLLLEHVDGAGEGLVSGRLDPVRLRLDRAGRVLERTGSAREGLSSGTLAALAAAGERLETAFGGPQDVEWVCGASGAAGDSLAFVQTRPITTVAPRREVFSNANVRENYPSPITPFLFSIARLGYEHYFRNLGLAFGISRARLEAMREPLEAIVGSHGARLYYNLTSIHRVLRLAPGGALLSAAFDRFVGAPDSGPPPEDAARWDAQGRAARALELAWVAGKTALAFARIAQGVGRFEATVAAYASRTAPARLREKPLPDLGEDLRGFLAIRTHWTDAALADTAAMIGSGALGALLGRDFPEEPALPSRLLQGLPGVVSNGPVLGLWELSRAIREDTWLSALFAPGARGDEVLAALRGDARGASFLKAFEAFLEAWGFRCSGELLLTVPSFEERPASLLEIVGAYARRAGESPAEALARQGALREAETRRVLARLSLPRRALLGRVLAITQSAIAFRERARLAQARLYSRLRHVLLALGERLVASGALAEREDVLFLTHAELDALASGSAHLADPRALVAARRAEHARLSALAPPDRLELLPGEAFAAGPSPREAGGGREEGARGAGVVAPPGNETLRGVPAGGGQAVGKARVLRCVSEASALEPGEILVCPQTDPGWGPALFLVRGLVVERGGLLSHGAILAREYGIPAVIGVEGATGRIVTGETIRVDGDRGHVRFVR